MFIATVTPIPPPVFRSWEAAVWLLAMAANKPLAAE